MEAKPERLQKILAAAGLASRRKAEEMIAAGLVSVNGHVITEPGTKADPRLDEIRVEGKLLRGPERHVYIAMYKPKGVMTTVSDPEGRPTVMDTLKGVEERVFPVGRLDYMSEGLLLLTNDGELMAQLTRAGSHVAKTYMVKVSGKPTEESLNKLRDGIMLPPEPGLTGARGKKQPGVERRSFAVRTQPADIQLAVDQENPWFEVTLTEGRNRQLRRMFEQIGHHIEKIKRVRYGSLTLDLEPGEFRYLTPKEVNQLRKSLETPFKPKRIKPKRMEERKPRLDTARFVKGRRGKPSPEAAESSAAAPERGTGRKFPSRAMAGSPSPQQRGFQSREDRPERRGGRPRGPEFAAGREERRPDTRGGQRRGFRPSGDFASERGGRGESAAPERRGGGPRAPQFAAGREERRPDTRSGQRRGFRPSGDFASERGGRGESGAPERRGGKRAGGFGYNRFGKPAMEREGKRRNFEGEGRAFSGSTAARRFYKGPGKPAPGESRDEGERGRAPAVPPRRTRGMGTPETSSFTAYPPRSAKPGFKRAGEARPGEGSKFGKSFGSRPAGREGGSKRAGGEEFKGGGKRRPPTRGGGAPRTPRRWPGEE